MQFLKKGYILLYSLLYPLIFLAQNGSQTFDASGTFTVPAGITRIYVEAWGGGGGGSPRGTAPSYTVTGAGGGGGGFSQGYYTVVPGNTLAVTVGSGGVAGAHGGESFLGNIGGGGGGRGVLKYNMYDIPNMSNGGLGGGGHYFGGDGGNGRTVNIGQDGNGGGGGGSARRSANGSDGQTGGEGGAGGDGEGKGGQGGTTNLFPWATPAATAGAVPGGGGGGGMPGGNGRVIVSWTAPITATVSQTPITCFGATAAAMVEASGGNGHFNYKWSPGDVSTAHIQNLQPGEYTCTITSGHAQTQVNLVVAEGPQTPGLTPAGNGSATVNQTADGNYNYYLSGCNTAIAMIYTNNAPNPLSGPVTARVWVDEKQDRRYVRRHYDILPQNNASVATARVTLFFTQEDFDAYNATRPRMPLPVDANDSRNYKGNIYIEKRSGEGNGIIENYTGAPVTIYPQEVAWDNSSNRWEVVFFTTGFSGFWLKTGDEPIPLPVSFGAIDAFIKQGTLRVNWTSLNETNNAYYLVEASADGTIFSTISDKIYSKATAGNSAIALAYSFTKSYTALQAMVLLALGLSVGCNSRKRCLLGGIMAIVCVLLVISCKKNGSDLLYPGDPKPYIRIVQVDKDGGKTFSKIVQAVQQ